MKFAQDGLSTILFLIFVTGAFMFIAITPAVVMGALTLLVMWFYRDPDRETPKDEDKNKFFSPADGRVVEISQVDHEFTGPAVKIGVFMNVFSVHVNRAVCDGRVDYLEYVPGKKIAAFAPKASEVNERNFVGLATKHGPVMMVQIAGLLARRVVCRLRRGDELKAGQRYGMIKLGSRVDIYLPQDVRLSIKNGDKVYAGISCLGYISKATGSD